MNCECIFPESIKSLHKPTY